MFKRGREAGTATIVARRDKKVEFDRDALRDDRKSAKATVDDSFEAAAAGAPGAIPAVPSSSPVAAQPGLAAQAADVSAAAADLSQTAARMAQLSHDVTDTLAAIVAASAAGDTAEVDRLKAEFARRSAERQPPAS